MVESCQEIYLGVDLGWEGGLGGCVFGACVQNFEGKVIISYTNDAKINVTHHKLK